MDHQERSAELEQETDKLERQSEELGQDIGQARSDWSGKKGDGSVPGAQDAEGANPRVEAAADEEDEPDEDDQLDEDDDDPDEDDDLDEDDDPDEN